MQDLRRIAERRASRPKSKPVGSSFETEHQRAKKAVVKQADGAVGFDFHDVMYREVTSYKGSKKNAATGKYASGKKKPGTSGRKKNPGQTAKIPDGFAPPMNFSMLNLGTARGGMAF